MSREKLEQTKRAAWFKGWDILIYALILLLLLALFLVLCHFSRGGNSSRASRSL